MQRAALQSFLAAIQTAGEQIPPEADAALPAAIKAWIPVARIRSCARETSHQAGVRCF
jgi:hypothetical protein